MRKNINGFLNQLYLEFHIYEYLTISVRSSFC